MANAITATIGADISGYSKKLNEVVSKTKEATSRSSKEISSISLKAATGITNTFKGVQGSITSMNGDLINGTGGAISGIMNKFGPMGMAAGAAFASVVAGASWASAEIDRMAKSADRLGISFEDFQRIITVASHSGIEESGVTKSLEQLVKKMEEASVVGSTMDKQFKRIGVSLKDSDGLARDTIDVYMDLADRMKDMSAAERTTTAMKLFGEEGKKMATLMAEGSEEMKKKMAEVTVVTEDQALAVQKLNDSMTGVFNGVKNSAKAVFGFIAEVVMGFPKVDKVQKSSEERVSRLRKATDDLRASNAKLIEDVDKLGTKYKSTAEKFNDLISEIASSPKTIVKIMNDSLAEQEKSFSERKKKLNKEIEDLYFAIGNTYPEIQFVWRNSQNGGQFLRWNDAWVSGTYLSFSNATPRLFVLTVHPKNGWNLYTIDKNGSMSTSSFSPNFSFNESFSYAYMGYPAGSRGVFATMQFTEFACSPTVLDVTFLRNEWILRGQLKHLFTQPWLQ